MINNGRIFIVFIVIILITTTSIYAQETNSNRIDIKASLPISLSVLGYGAEASFYSNHVRTNIGFTFLGNGYWWVGPSQSNSEGFYGMPLMYGDISYCFLDTEIHKSFLGVGYASQEIVFYRSGTVDVNLYHFSSSPFIIVGYSINLFKHLCLEVDYFGYMDWFNDIVGNSNQVARFGIDHITDTTILKNISGGFKVSLGVSL